MNMDLFGSGASAAAAAATAAGQIGEQRDEGAEMLAFMNALTEMAEKDPEQYAALQAAAAASAATSAAGQEGGGNGGEGTSGGTDPAATEAATKALMDALQRQAAAAAGQSEFGQDADGGIRLPGNAGRMGADGVSRPNQKGIEIEPVPGFVVKTRESEGGAKVFINVCTHECIGEPAPKKRLDDDGNEVEGINVPISLGPRRETTDNSGEACGVYDCVVNPQVVQNAKEDKTGGQRDFVCQLAIHHIEQKYSISLDSRYKLPRMTYKGDVAKQWVRDPKQTPTIQEISSSENEAGASVMAAREQQQSATRTSNTKRKKQQRSRGGGPAAKSGNTAGAKSTDAANLPPGPPEAEAKIIMVHMSMRMSDGELFDLRVPDEAAEGAADAAGEGAGSNKNPVEFLALEDFPLLDMLETRIEQERKRFERAEQTPSGSSNDVAVDPSVAGLLDPTEIDTLESASAKPRPTASQIVLNAGGMQCSPADLDVQISAFRFSMSAPGVQSVVRYFPCTVIPETAQCRLSAGGGLHVTVDVDRSSPMDGPDPGSRAWMLARALKDEEREAAAASRQATADEVKTNGVGAGDDDDDDALPEDRFHLKLPKNVDKYTGMALDENVVEPPDVPLERTVPGLSGGVVPTDTGNDELPEDRFHRTDAMSQHILAERERNRQEKEKQRDREREENKDNENVEYIDLEDYAPKHSQAAAAGSDQDLAHKVEASDVTEAAATVLQQMTETSEERAKHMEAAAHAISAAEEAQASQKGGAVLAAASTSDAAHGSTQGGTTAGQTASGSQKQFASSSRLWSELLD